MRKPEVCQNCWASLLDDDEEDIEDAEDEDEDLSVLRNIPDVSQRSDDGTGASGAIRSASAADKEGTARKRTAPSPPRGPSSKRSCVGVDGGQSSPSTALADPSLEGHEEPAQGEGVEDTAATDVVLGADGETRRPSSEASGGEGRDLLQHLLVNVEVEHSAPSAPRMEAFEVEEAGTARNCGAEEINTAGMARDA